MKRTRRKLGRRRLSAEQKRLVEQVERALAEPNVDAKYAITMKVMGTRAGSTRDCKLR